MAQRTIQATCTATILIFALVMPCSAQSQTDSTPPGNAKAGATEGALEEIVVTAQRRQQNDKDVPISITAITGDQLDRAGISDTTGLQTLTPGLRMDVQGSSFNPTIRGVSSSLSQLVAPNVVTYIDDVLEQNNQGAVYDLPDVSNVQVLKGPQGTLFGRNATGGAILINTREPNLKEAEGTLALSYGRFDESVLKGFVSLPVIPDELALGFSGYYTHRDGFYDDLLNGGKAGGLESYLFRGKALFVPWDGARFVLTGMVSRRYDEDTLSLTNLNGNNAARGVLPPSEIASEPYQYGTDDHTFVLTKETSVSLRGTIDVPSISGSLTTSTGYSDVPVSQVFDSDNTALALGTAAVVTDSKTFTQEILYNTTASGPFRGTAGAYYYWNVSKYDPVDFFYGVNYDPNGSSVEITRDTDQAHAFFGNAEYDITNVITVAAGVRYNDEVTTGSVVNYPSTQPQPPLKPLGSLPETAWTPRASLTYKLTPDLNVYGSYSQGFKNGFYNSLGVQTSPIEPERLKAYEVGMKGAYDRFRVNADAFYYDYSSLQVSSYNGITTIVDNGASARIYGAELEGAAQLVRGLQVNGGIAYLHARYDRFPDASAYVPNTNAPPTCAWGTSLPLENGNQALSCNASGKTLPRSPAVSGNVSLNYVTNTPVGALDNSLTAYFSSRVYYEVLDRISQAPYQTLDARVALRPKNAQQLEIAVYGRNLTNAVVLDNLVLQSRYDAVNYALPRTYGVQFRYDF
jgi:iron complex outermembrane recepter protein